MLMLSSTVVDIHATLYAGFSNITSISLSWIFCTTAFLSFMPGSLVTCWRWFPLLYRGISPPVSVRGVWALLIFSALHPLLNATLHMHKDAQPTQIILSCNGTNRDMWARKHTSMVLSFLLVLTAHQRPVSACRNTLTSTISLKSLSIRDSCTGPS